MRIERVGGQTSRFSGRIARAILKLGVLALLGAACAATTGAPGQDEAYVANPVGTEPVGLFLTWREDPSTTMVVDWHTVGEGGEAVLQYRRAGSIGGWESRAARTTPLPQSPRSIHRVELTRLAPDATYEFRLGEGSRSYLFRTMPRKATRPIRFIAAGDTQHEQEWMAATARQVTPYEPDFIMLGGDLSYAIRGGEPEQVDRWHSWFDTVKETLITPAGRVIPILVTIGNHEVAGSYYDRIPDYRQDDETRARVAHFFYRLFASPGQPGYRVIDFGRYLSVILLDSDHTNPIAGVQTTWLEEVLRARRDVPHVFPLYHVPGYPSARVFEGEVSRRVREHWVPLFERYGVQVAFENHDHLYKRTYPLRGGQRDTAGVVYLGDGAWGTEVRPIGRDWEEGERPWYLERAESVRHFIVGEIHGGERYFIMVDAEGKVFDEYPAGSGELIEVPRRAAVASGVAGMTLPLVWQDTVRAAVVTEPVLGDSDDPAIWIDRADPTRTLILGTDKHNTNGGVYAFTLAGKIDSARTVTGLKRVNNVDVAYGLGLGGEAVDIAAATERNRQALRIFSLPEMRLIDGGGITLFDGDTSRAPMGIALYRRPRDGTVFAIVGGKSGPRSGYLWQYRLEDDGQGRVRGVKVREFGAYSGKKEIEAIAVDNELGYVYYSDETVGIRKYHADPDAGDAELALFGTTGFVRDHEGIGIYKHADGTGYILVSDQQGQRLQVFRREGEPGSPHAHPAIAVIPISALETDGLEVTSTPLGPAYPRGLLVMMSTDRTFHYFRWEDIEARLPARVAAR